MVIKKAKPIVEDKSYICGLFKEIKVRARRFQYSSFRFMPKTTNSANHVLAEKGRRYASFMYWIEEDLVRVDEEACLKVLAWYQLPCSKGLVRYIPITTTGSTNSTATTHVCPPFTSVQLVQSFPRQDTINLDDTNFVQWKQHIRLITDGYNLTGFLDGSLLILPRFMSSPNGSLVLNPDTSAYFQQDKFLASGFFPP
ncbi:hypothetical protein J1N35_010103 [Gossypium stocksii]|uniref:Retrotransposon Copia-like N-terminal domain-containing protein n=1 Tax=Gossypium stocksii TaxID=47602 RepID=A0A9D4ACA2_9ROSI|nr:hypothetical protein J1N35_010103 [Gossypium stocksii]